MNMSPLEATNLLIVLAIFSISVFDFGFSYAWLLYLVAKTINR